jgi:hypothetical protein
VVACTRAFATSRSQVPTHIGRRDSTLSPSGPSGSPAARRTLVPGQRIERSPAHGPGSIGLSQPPHEAMMMHEIEGGTVVPMQSRSVATRSGHHRPHVVIEHLVRDPPTKQNASLAGRKKAELVRAQNDLNAA